VLRSLSISFVFAGLGLCLTACSDGIPEGCDAWVTSTADAQDAVQKAFLDASGGDVVCLSQGDFSGFEKEITLSADDVIVQGQGLDATVLDFDGQEGANGIKITGDGVTIRHLQVKNTPGDAIRADQVEDITYDSVKVHWEGSNLEDHGAYGLYPIGSTGVTIRDSIVEGARDAGVYVGQSEDILVIDNEAAFNVAGIEVENSFDAEVRGNYAHDNTAGLLIFNLPGLAEPGGARTKAYENRIESNNIPNFAPGGVVAEVPTGTGLMVLAADHGDIHDNEILGNEGAAIIVVHCQSPGFLEGCEEDPDYDPYPRGNFIHDNVLSNNGNNPPKWVIDLVGGNEGMLPVPDIFWSGGHPGCPDADIESVPQEDLNCFSNNAGDAGPATFVNFNLCNSFQDKTNDMGPMACTHPGLEPMGE
jgi:parallel beta-helix repeat protein